MVDHHINLRLQTKEHMENKTDHTVAEYNKKTHWGSVN